MEVNVFPDLWWERNIKCQILKLTSEKWFISDGIAPELDRNRKPLHLCWNYSNSLKFLQGRASVQYIANPRIKEGSHNTGRQNGTSYCEITSNMGLPESQHLLVIRTRGIICVWVCSYCCLLLVFVLFYFFSWSQWVKFFSYKRAFSGIWFKYITMAMMFCEWVTRIASQIGFCIFAFISLQIMPSFSLPSSSIISKLNHSAKMFHRKPNN